MAREAAKATKVAAYERGVEETEIRLAEEVARVCRDYCIETWTGIIDFELRKAESIFFPKHIREAPVDLPPTIALPLPPPKPASNPRPYY